MKPLFKSEAAVQTLRDWYDRFHAHIPSPTTRRTVDTRFGATHVLSGGAPGAPDLVILHGALASSAHLLRELAPLMDHFRVHAIDVMGQSVMSAPNRLSPKNDDHGLWLADVMDALSLPTAHLLGVSWGGFAALRFTAIAPQRVRKLALLVPAGVVKGPFFRGFVRMGWPLTRFLMKPTPARRDKLTAALLTTPDPEWAAYLGDAFTSYNLGFSIPKLATPTELAAYTNPVLVVAADNDVSFPGAKLIAHAKLLFKGRIETELLVDCNHSPPTTDAFRAQMSARIATFLGAP